MLEFIEYLLKPFKFINSMNRKLVTLFCLTEMSQISRRFFGTFDVNVEKQCTFSLEKNLLEVLTLDLK